MINGGSNKDKTKRKTYCTSLKVVIIVKCDNCLPIKSGVFMFD